MQGSVCSKGGGEGGDGGGRHGEEDEGQEEEGGPGRVQENLLAGGRSVLFYLGLYMATGDLGLAWRTTTHQLPMPRPAAKPATWEQP